MKALENQEKLNERPFRNSVPFAEALGASFGQDFLDQLAESLVSLNENSVVLIGQFRVSGSKRIHVLAKSSTIGEISLSAYNVCGTPCEKVVLEGREFTVSMDAFRKFPDDRLFQKKEIHSYIAAPLKDAGHSTIGLIAIISQNPIEDPSETLEVIRRYAPRAGGVIEAMETRHTLETIINGAALPSQGHIFRHLTIHAARALRAKSCLVAECIDDDPDRFRILAISSDGEPVIEKEGAIRAYNETPCIGLKQNDVVIIEDNAPDIIPEATVLKKNGIVAYIGAVLRGNQGNTIGHIAFFHDRPVHSHIKHSQILNAFAVRAATEVERHRAEVRRQQMEEALLTKKKVESLGVMAGAIAHDFNNLLASILGYTELALAEIPPNMSGREYLLRVETGAVRAKELIAQLLDYAGKDIGHRPVEMDINQLVGDALDLMPQSLRNKFAIVLQMAPEPLVASVDRTRFTQVLLNLLLNAVDAMQDRIGKIAVKTERVSLKDQERDFLVLDHEKLTSEAIRISVRDQGIGISQTDISRIFDPFYTTKSDGRGLGLAAVRGMMQSHQGGIGVSSMLGNGTEFQLYLPPAESKETVSDVDIGDAVPDIGNGGTVLLVDDEPGTREVVAAQIKSIGLDILEAENCQTALDALSNAQGGQVVALIDVTMPGIDGWQTAQKLRDMAPSLPVIMMSGYFQKEEMPESALDGSAQMIAKPFRRDDLKQALFDALSGEPLSAN